MPKKLTKHPKKLTEHQLYQRYSYECQATNLTPKETAIRILRMMNVIVDSKEAWAKLNRIIEYLES